MARTPHTRRLSAGAMLGLLAMAIAWSGCSSRLPSAPEVESAPSSQVTATARDRAAPSGLLGGLAGGLLGGGSAPADPNWYLVANQWVPAGSVTAVQGGRYKLKFYAGSLSQGAQIQVREYNPNVLDFQLDPHGIQFGTPVDLTIDYRGTNVDPLSPNWDGTLPLFLWFNPASSLWEIVPGLNNPLTRTYHVKLQHFSRYQLTTEKQGGTAEW